MRRRFLLTFLSSLVISTSNPVFKMLPYGLRKAIPRQMYFPQISASLQGHSDSTPDGSDTGMRVDKGVSAGVSIGVASGDAVGSDVGSYARGRGDFFLLVVNCLQKTPFFDLNIARMVRCSK